MIPGKMQCTQGFRRSGHSLQLRWVDRPTLQWRKGSHICRVRGKRSRGCLVIPGSVIILLFCYWPICFRNKGTNPRCWALDYHTNPWAATSGRRIITTRSLDHLTILQICCISLLHLNTIVWKDHLQNDILTLSGSRFFRYRKERRGGLDSNPPSIPLKIGR